jgi:hypothetical protein
MNDKDSEIAQEFEMCALDTQRSQKTVSLRVQRGAKVIQKKDAAEEQRRCLIPGITWSPEAAPRN